MSVYVWSSSSSTFFIYASYVFNDSPLIIPSRSLSSMYSRTVPENTCSQMTLKWFEQPVPFLVRHSGSTFVILSARLFPEAILKGCTIILCGHNVEPSIWDLHAYSIWMTWSPSSAWWSSCCRKEAPSPTWYLFPGTRVSGTANLPLTHRWSNWPVPNW